MTRDCDVVVIGGGIAGLAAAWHLRDRDVVVLEASDRLGGRIRSERRGEYWLNFGAHVFAGPGSASRRLIEEVGVETRPVPGRLAAVSLNGKLVSSGPVELFPFRLPLRLGDRLALGRAGIRLRLAVRRYAAVARERPGESAAERQQRMLEFMDDRSFSAFIGRLPPDVDALFRCTLTRSSGEPEKLAAGYGVGYFHLVWNRGDGLSTNIVGGSSTLTEGIAAELGARVLTNARVERVTRVDGGVVVASAAGEFRARSAIVAAPAYVTRTIVDGLPEETAKALAAIPYGPYVLGGFLTNETGPAPWDDIYALATPKRSFGIVFNTGNALRIEGRRDPGGSITVSAAARRGAEPREPLGRRGRRALSGGAGRPLPRPRRLDCRDEDRPLGARPASPDSRPREAPARVDPRPVARLPRGRLPRLVVHRDRIADGGGRRRASSGNPLMIDSG